jgi:thymidylate synthase (FAD)
MLHGSSSRRGTVKVTLLAHTHITNNVFDLMQVDHGTNSIDTLTEVAGRACYQSFHKPNPATAANKDYLANIIEQKHFSVLEHGSATFYVEGVSRSLTHELVRHRHLSYSQLSQRYVDISDTEFVFPPALLENWDENLPTEEDGSSYTVAEEVINLTSMTTLSYQALAETLEAKGLPRKRAREAARAVMPNMTETKIVVTGNLRAWRDFLTKRHSVHADREIQVLAAKILEHLREIAPHAVQDIPDEPYA